MPIILKLLELTVPTLLTWLLSKQQEKKKELVSAEAIAVKATNLAVAVAAVKDGLPATKDQKVQVKAAIKDLIKPGKGIV